MPAKRELTMRQIRELIRLDHEGVGAREIARRLGVARSTVQDNLHRVRSAGLTWPLPPALTDEVLEQKLFRQPGVKAGLRQHTEPDWASLAREMKRPAVNLTVLWEEYRQRHPDGYSYSRFCDLFRHFERRLSPVMRQHHVAGAKLFVDYSGKRVPIINPATGMVHEAELFVAVLGASNYTYAEATWTQSLPDWIGAHIRMFRFYDGVPRLLVPDNLKAGIHRASFYDPEVNRSYAMMAAHYDVGIWPARPRKPKDKAKVEAGVRFAQTYIIGRLRNHRFFSLQECNAAIRAALTDMNGRAMRRLGLSRRELFESIEQAALRPLPQADWEYAEWRLARVAPDYHIEADGFFYSVPHALIREQVDIRLTRYIIEVFHRGKRVAVHHRRFFGRRHGTDPDHMPSSHRRYAQWTPERFRRWARSIGPQTEGLIIAILANRPHPEQGFRTCLGVLRLYRALATERAESVSARAVAIGAFNYKSIGSILANNLDRTPPATSAAAVIDHAQSPRQKLFPLTGQHMLAHPTLDLFRQLGLHGMAKGLQDLAANSQAGSLDHLEWLGLLLEYEQTWRRQKRFEMRARVARLRQAASVEDVDYRAARGLDRGLFLKLAACGWIQAHCNLIITGPCGVGKTWLACALGHKACREDYSVRYYRIPRLFAALALTRGDGRYAKLLRMLARVRLLILDDWGPEPLNPDQRRDFLEIVEDRYDAGSMLIISQVPVDRWYEVIGNPTLADAILDRLVHNSHRIELAGESLRKLRAKPLCV